jgi:hypothetical protein
MIQKNPANAATADRQTETGVRALRRTDGARMLLTDASKPE